MSKSLQVEIDNVVNFLEAPRLNGIGPLYEALRQEIITNAEMIAEVFTISITVAVIIIGYGIQRTQEQKGEASSGLLFLCPLGILIPSLWFIFSQLGSTVQIATYIQTFLEKEQEAPNWEARLSLLRQAGTELAKLYTLSISTIYRIRSSFVVASGLLYQKRNAKQNYPRSILFGVVRSYGDYIPAI